MVTPRDLVMPKDAVFYAIRREYRSRRVNLARDLETVQRLSAELAALQDAIYNNGKALEQLTRFAAERGWDARDLDL